MIFELLLIAILATLIPAIYFTSIYWLHEYKKLKEKYLWIRKNHEPIFYSSPMIRFFVGSPADVLRQIRAIDPIATIRVLNNPNSINEINTRVSNETLRRLPCINKIFLPGNHHSHVSKGTKSL